MSNKCILCNLDIFKRNFCEKHYLLVRENILRLTQEIKKKEEYKGHYHNLRYSIIKMSNKNHIIENLIKLIAIAEVVLLVYKDAVLTEKVYDFTKLMIYRMMENEQNNEEEYRNLMSNKEAEMDLRKKWSRDFLCDDGHYVRSVSELAIDNWLYKNNIIHSYEKRCFLKNAPQTIIISDFYIPSLDVYIEYWGKYEKKYIARKRAKQKLYTENNINVINIEFDDMKHLNDYMIASLFKNKQ